MSCVRSTIADPRNPSSIVLLAAILAIGVSGCNRSLGGGKSGRDDSCDDGTTPACRMQEPQCESWEILAYQENCYVCVNPDTCLPWGQAGCQSDADCPVEQYCDPCASSSCPMCADCLSACVDHGCETEPYTVCNALRPDCGFGQVAVARDGCWVCVELSTCEPGRDARCDDGTQPICPDDPPQCESWEILAYQNQCFRCVNPETCRPWGEPGCENDADCTIQQYCNDCASSSCPECLDCVAACSNHNCPTDPDVTCDMERPECGLQGVAVSQNGCWTCVDIFTCDPVRDDHCDDGTQPMCNMPAPECEAWEILAYQEHCYVCVNPLTCHPWGEPGCESDQDCSAEQYCDPCGSSSCPGCEDCVPACIDHGCPTETLLLCYGVRPDCDPGQVAVIEDGCWVCVDMNTCQ